jgi:hypothetical protein
MFSKVHAQRPELLAQATARTARSITYASGIAECLLLSNQSFHRDRQR